MILYDKFIMRFKNNEMEIKLQNHPEKLTKKDIPFLIGLFSIGLFYSCFIPGQCLSSTLTSPGTHPQRVIWY